MYTVHKHKIDSFIKLIGGKSVNDETKYRIHVILA